MAQTTSSQNTGETHSPEAIIVLDFNGTITKADRQTVHLFGWDTEQEVVGRRVVDFVTKEDQLLVRDAFQAILLNGSIADFRCTAVKKDGSPLSISANGTLFVDSQGNPDEVIVILHELAGDKELDKAKTEFISLVSHQMRGPLTAINWHAEMLLQQQSTGLTDTQKNYIQELYKASKQTVRLTNTLLAVSELELGRMPYKPEKIEIPKIAKRVLGDYQHTIIDKKIIQGKKINVLPRRTPVKKESGEESVAPEAKIASEETQNATQKAKDELAAAQNQTVVALDGNSGGFMFALLNDQ